MDKFPLKTVPRDFKVYLNNGKSHFLCIRDQNTGLEYWFMRSSVKFHIENDNFTITSSIKTNYDGDKLKFQLGNRKRLKNEQQIIQVPK